MNDKPVDSDQTEVLIRRAPKYPAFIIVGGGIGAIATLILTSFYPADPQVGFGALFGYFALFGIPFGALFGALIALALDRRARRRARSATARRESALPESG